MHELAAMLLYEKRKLVGCYKSLLLADFRQHSPFVDELVRWFSAMISRSVTATISQIPDSLRQQNR